MPSNFDERIVFLNKELVKQIHSSYRLEEQDEKGKTSIELTLENDMFIAFEKMETHKISYLKNQCAADYILLQLKEDNWYVHIFELKRTVKDKSWKHIKKQFSGSLQNIIALAGFLNIQIVFEKVFLYTAYRNDTINNTSDPVKQRFENMLASSGKAIDSNNTDWNNKTIFLDFESNTSFVHKKIPLDLSTGSATYSIA
ncbi:MAG: hypothetical protein K2M50_09585 [Treponemataceae bacterium]|nr:hypothetical protein [Treponemataceae bacterium]